MSCRTSCWLVFLLVIAPISWSNARTIYINKNNGLPCNEVYDLHKDKQGFVWLATDLGLYRYDGYEYKPYRKPNMRNLAGSHIQEDENGTIWYATFDGELFFTSHDSLQEFTLSYKTNPNPAFVVVEDIHYMLNNIGNVEYTKISTKKHFKTVSLPNYSNGYSTVCNNKIIINGHQDFYEIDMHGNVSTYSCLYQNTKTHLFCSNGKTVITIEEDEQSKYVIAHHGKTKSLVWKFPATLQINKLLIDHNDLFVLSKEGAYIISLSDRKILSHLFPDESISDRMMDPEGNEWYSSNFNGLHVVLKKELFKQYALPQKANKIKVINNQIFLFSATGVVFVFDTVHHSFQTVFEDKSKGSLYDIIPIEPYNYNIGIYNSIVTSSFRYKNQYYLVFKNGIKQVATIKDQFIATALTGSSNISKIKNVNTEWDNAYRQYFQFTSNGYDKADFDVGYRVYSVVYDSLFNTIFYATNNGLLCVSPTQRSYINFQNKPVYAAKLASYNGTIYIKLHTGELYEYNIAKKTHKLSSLNSLATITFIKQQDSALFVVANHKVVHYSLTNHHATIITTPNNSSFAIDDIAMLKDNYYLLANNLLSEIPQGLNTQEEIVPFILHGVKTNKRSYSAYRSLSLSPSEHEINIHFSLLNYFSAPAEVYYKINNTTWKKVNDGTQEILLAALDYGQYTVSFMVNGKLMKEMVTFSIAKPFYIQWWFLCVSSFSVFLAIYFYYKRRLAQQKSESALLLEKANLEKDLRQSMLSSIKSQMNPHFLFNALNTIQSYIIDEDKENASDYLSKFSKLTRKILNNSDLEYISLAEELESLQLYTELEKMRFEDIHSTLIIAQTINPSEILIPSMIIQPYVENAIKHGLLHKQGDKNVLIEIIDKATQIEIIVEDNGIGRRCSEAINAGKKNHHISFAANANLKRVALLANEKNKVGIHYIDKTDNEGNDIGTKVIITLPKKFTHDKGNNNR